MNIRRAICVVGILTSACVLIASGFSQFFGGHGAHLIEMNGRAVFIGALLIASIGLALTAIRGQFWMAVVTGIAINVLFGMSFVPLYVEHDDIRGLTHRHHLWELGHVH